MRKTLYAALTIIALLPSTVVAQSVVDRLQSKQLLDPQRTTSFSSLHRGIIFSASKGEDEVEAQYGWVIGGISTVFKLTTPLSEGSADTEILRVESLGATSIGLSLGRLLITGDFDAAQISKWCNDQKTKGKLDGTRINCDSFRRAELPSQELKDDYDKHDMFGNFSMLFGLSGQLARPAFEYVELVSGDSADTKHTASSLGADFGFMTEIGLFTIGGGHKWKHKAGPKALHCSTTGAISTCNEVHLGGPTDKSGYFAKAQFRRFLTAKLGLAVRYAHDFAEKKTTADAPVFFIPDADGGLIGGAGPRWNSETKNWSAVVFIGSALGLKL